MADESTRRAARVDVDALEREVKRAGNAFRTACYSEREAACEDFKQAVEVLAAAARQAPAPPATSGVQRLPSANVLAIIDTYAGEIRNAGFCPSKDERAEIDRLKEAVVRYVTALDAPAAQPLQAAGVEAPWPDFAGNPIRHGDRLRHPSGETFVAVKLDQPDLRRPWRAIYDETAQALGSDLGLQIGDKGQAVLATPRAPEQAAQPVAYLRVNSEGNLRVCDPTFDDAFPVVRAAPIADTAPAVREVAQSIYTQLENDRSVYPDGIYHEALRAALAAKGAQE